PRAADAQTDLLSMVQAAVAAAYPGAGQQAYLITLLDNANDLARGTEQEKELTAWRNVLIGRGAPANPPPASPPPVRLTYPQQNQLVDALLSAFPSQEEVARLMLQGLNVQLSTIASDGSLRGSVDSIIQWAAAQDRVSDLIRAARAANPGNSALQ